MIHDVHSHFVPAEVLQWLRDNAHRVNATWAQRVAGKEPFLTVQQKWSFELKRAFYESDLYLSEQHEAGIGHTLVSPIPQLFLYDASPELTIELSQCYNQALASFVKSNPERLSGLATLPLNDSMAAAAALNDAMELGLRGAIIGPGHGQIPLTDEYFAPLWEVANRKRAILFVHPLLNEDPRIQRKNMSNLIGVPWETTICGLDLMLGGVLDKWPNVKILLAHGGGFLPYQVGRLNQGYASWPILQESLNDSPESYLKRFWYDNVLWHPEALSFLQKTVGVERVLSGSDYPFDLRSWPPVPASEWAVQSFFHRDSV